MRADLDSRIPSFRIEREFGLIVGGVFVLLGGWWFFRGKLGFIPYGLVALGIVLIILAVTHPKALVLPNRAWMALAEMLGFIMTRIILAIVFYSVVTPIGLTKRLQGWDPLRLRATPSKSYWEPYSTRQRDPRHYEQMY